MICSRFLRAICSSSTIKRLALFSTISVPPVSVRQRKGSLLLLADCLLQRQFYDKSRTLPFDTVHADAALVLLGNFLRDKDAQSRALALILSRKEGIEYLP